jgi:hypothetical protein
MKASRFSSDAPLSPWTSRAPSPAIAVAVVVIAIIIIVVVAALDSPLA